ncbi:MAG: hypothetical protein K6C40_00105 [Thermoguttaceae bacterium]|nr:hypothetical protein [Thermoguttaceae bacterium]
MEISDELISDPEDDILTDAPLDPAAQTSRQKAASEVARPVKTNPESGSDASKPQAQAETGGFFKPLREGEVEIPMVRKVSAPILPEDVLVREMPKFHSQIQQTSKPGFILESTHFLIEADPYWTARTAQLVKIVQLAEETRCESELVASLWRNPVFTSSNPRDLNAPMVPSQSLNSGVNVLRPEFSGTRIRLRVVHPENSPFHVTSCQLTQEENQQFLLISAEKIQDFDRLGLRRRMRREIFYTMLCDGQENRIFPVWLQNGLADVFSGQEATPSRREENLLSRLSVLAQSPEDSHGQTAVSLVRYCLTSNDGKAFFPFWEQLARIYQNGGTSLQGLGQHCLLSALEEKIRENQRFSQGVMGNFFRELESNRRNESFTNWQKSLTSVSGGDSVRVFWFPEAQVLNVETTEPQLPRLGLDESWKEAFLEMVQVLKMTDLGRNSPNFLSFLKTQTETASRVQTHGVKIQEFRENETPNSGLAAQESAQEDSKTATAEELQKLDWVFEWLKKDPQNAISLNADGSLFFENFTPGRLQKIFHPQDRTYLLQEYGGNLVLSATFQDDYVLHVIMEKSPETTGAAEIRILGIEKPESAGNQK